MPADATREPVCGDGTGGDGSGRVGGRHGRDGVLFERQAGPGRPTARDRARCGFCDRFRCGDERVIAVLVPVTAMAGVRRQLRPVLRRLVLPASRVKGRRGAVD